MIPIPYFDIYHIYIGIMQPCHNRKNWGYSCCFAKRSIMINIDEQGTSLFKNSEHECNIKWAMKKCDSCCGALKWRCARSLARLLLLLVHLLCLLLPTRVVMWWSSSALLARTSCTCQMAVGGLRVFLGCLLAQLQLVRLMPVFALAFPIFGLGTRAPMCSLLGWTTTVSTVLWQLLGKNGLSWAVWNMPLHLLPQSHHSTQTFATGEVCLVMGIDNMVQECQIILYGIGTEWATWYPWFMPILCLFGQEDWNACKHVAWMEFL